MLDKGEWRQVLVTTVEREVEQIQSTFGGIPVGLALAFTGSAIPQLEAKPLEMHHTATSMIGSAMPLAAMLAGPIAGWSLDKFGRCGTMIIANIPAIIGYCLLGFLRSVAGLIVGRLLIGFSVGFSTVVGPMYVGEVADTKVRDFMGAVFQTQAMNGLFLSFLFGKYLAWYNLAFVSGAFSVVWLLSITLSCESPMYLIEKNHEEKARKNLSWLRGDRDDIDDELQKIRDEVERERAHKASVLDLFKPQNRWGFGIALLTLSMQQLCGINAIMFYTTKIFQDAGGKMEASDCSIVVSAVQVVAMLIVIEAVHCLGRRPMLIVSSIAIGLSMLAVGVFFFLKDGGKDVSSITWIPLVSIIVVVIAFCFGLGPIPFILMGEVLADEISGLGGGISVFSLWLSAFLVTMTFAPLMSVITTAGVFWMYTVICFIGAAAMYFTVIETHGKSLEEIQEILQGGTGGGGGGGDAQTAIETEQIRPDSQAGGGIVLT